MQLLYVYDFLRAFSDMFSISGVTFVSHKWQWDNNRLQPGDFNVGVFRFLFFQEEISYEKSTLN